MSASPANAPVETGADVRRPAYTVAGYLSAMAIFASLIGLAWHPLRLIAPSIVLSLVAAGMAPRGNRLAQTAVATVAVCFFVGLLIAVVTERALW
jgi:hypothetical protein